MPLIGTRKFPRGPSLKFLEEHLFNLSGTRVKFSAPEHNHDSIPVTPPHDERINLYENGLFGRFDVTDLAEPPSYPIELKYWRFRGVPILDGTGVLGDMRFHVSIIHLPEFSNIFRPKNLECAIERCIYGSPYAHRTSGECRLDWKVTMINHSIWVSYHSGNISPNDGCSFESVWHAPISDQHLLTVRFDQVIRKKRTRLAEVYQNIINKVMSSFQIQLSSDAQSQLDAVKRNFPCETLSETLPPYEFEEIDILGRLDLINQVSAENNHDFSIPDDVFEEQVQKKDRDQKRKAKDAKEKILASHLRFKEMN